MITGKSITGRAVITKVGAIGNHLNVDSVLVPIDVSGEGAYEVFARWDDDGELIELQFDPMPKCSKCLPTPPYCNRCGHAVEEAK